MERAGVGGKTGGEIGRNREKLIRTRRGLAGGRFRFSSRPPSVRFSFPTMTTPDALALIRSQLQRMDALYGRPVFDEWALLGLGSSGQASVLGYEGPRAESFALSVAEDAAALRAAQAKRDYGVGDFEFVHEEAGQGLDAFLRAGLATYLVCNHTGKAMADIRREPRWRQAQVAWFDLGEKFRADPVAG